MPYIWLSPILIVTIIQNFKINLKKLISPNIYYAIISLYFFVFALLHMFVFLHKFWYVLHAIVSVAWSTCYSHFVMLSSNITSFCCNFLGTILILYYKHLVMLSKLVFGSLYKGILQKNNRELRNAKDKWKID